MHFNSKPSPPAVIRRADNSRIPTHMLAVNLVAFNQNQRPACPNNNEEKKK